MAIQQCQEWLSFITDVVVVVIFWGDNDFCWLKGARSVAVPQLTRLFSFSRGGKEIMFE